MSRLNLKVEQLHTPMDKWLLRIGVIVLAFAHVGLFMWEPQSYADRIGGFSPILGVLFVWSLCAAMVYGIGFKPRYWLWQLVFSPYLTLSVLAYMSALYL